LKRKIKAFFSQISERTAFVKVDEWFSKKVFNRDISEIIVCLSFVCYALVFSYFTILKFNTFNAYAWDLGIFSQSLWTTVHAGEFFYSTPELFINPSGVFFGIHFSPILFTVLPFYSLHSSPLTLLVFQSFILGMGAIPLYFFAKRVLNVRTTAVAFSLAYLLYPPLHGVNWFDFHVQSFLPLFFFCTIYFLSKEKWSLYFMFLFLSLTVAENVPILIIFLGAYCFWVYRRQLYDAVRKRISSDKRIFIPPLTILTALFWRFLAIWIQQTYFPINPEYSQLYSAVDNWSVLGIQDDPITLPIYLILNMGKGIEAISYDFYFKLFYIFLLFGPLLFLSFRSLITGITLAWLVPAILSNYTPYYIIGVHFPAYVIAFIFLGAVYGAKKSVHSNRFPNLRFLTKSLVLVSLVFAIFVSPLSPVMLAFQDNTHFFASYYPPNIITHDRLLHTIVDIVPRDASILTQNNIFPHFSSRVNAYAYPVPVILDRAPHDAMDQYLNEIILKSDFILVDTITDPSTSAAVIERVDVIGIYGVFAYADGIYLLKKDFQGDPVFHVP
jgi:uncharacterized membrane protein